jgi:DNA primase
MKFPRHFLDTLNERINISEVVGAVVQLKHKARGEFVGLCPFHNEKSPSFTVSDAKGFYHCFGCGAHGTALNFVMEKRGLSFGEAVKELAQQAGMQLPKMEVEDVVRQKKLDDSFAVTESATKFFQASLYSPEGAKALEYFYKRNISDETIKQFRLGFSPERKDAVFKHLISEGAEADLIEANGLCIKSDKNGEYFDRFRGRVIFPIFDQKNRPIAFGGRILGKVEGVAKYLNSPETELFKKGYVLYGYNFARDIAFKKQNIAVVEGYMDVIAMHQAGIKNAVAPLGTAVTENHLKTLWRITKEPVFCLDGDEAGLRAMKRLAEEFIAILEPGYSMKFALLPNGQDPDEIIKTEGLNALRSVLAGAIPLSEALWKINYNEKSIDTPEKKAEFSAKLLKLSGNIKNQEVKDFYANYFKTKLNELKFNFKTNKPTFAKNQKTSLFSNLSGINNKSTEASEKFKTTLLLIIYKNPELLNDSEIEHSFAELSFINKNLNVLHEQILNTFFEAAIEINHNNLRMHLENSGFIPQVNYAESITTRDFYYKENQPRNLIISAWNLFLLNNNLEETKKEYINFISHAEVDFEKAQSLEREIQNLENKLLEERKNFETLKEQLIGE